MNILRLACINIAFFAALLTIADVFISSMQMGRSIVNPSIPRFNIPRITCGQATDYDVSSIYRIKAPLIVHYKRDSLCYRSRNKSSSNNIVLTIGGSTTDQRFVDEGDTFQDILDLKFKGEYDFINGGVDGQSTIGHLEAIKIWHAKALNTRNIRHIIYYIGVNDQGFDKLKSGLFSKSYTGWRRIQDYLSVNSYTYSQIKNSIFNRSLPKSKEIMAVHGAPFVPTDNPVKGSIQVSLKESIAYQEHILNLLTATHKLFPYASIHIIQQQVPGCRFKTSTNFIDRHRSDLKGVCESLANVYTAMDAAIIRSPLLGKISVHPMYQLQVIPDDGFYDFIHTNKKGSGHIADYINEAVKFKDNAKESK